MNVSVMQENLARGLQIVSRAVSSRATLPVLANVLLKTENAGLKLTATNLEIGISCWVPGKVEDEGEITVPARLVTDLVASLPNQRIDLQLSAKDRTLHLTCGGSKSTIKGIEADEFPVVAAIGEGPTTSVSARALREALGEVVFAAASDDPCCAVPTLKLMTMYKEAGVPFEAHIPATGGHGFNMGQRSAMRSVHTWPDRLADWLADRGLLGR